MNYIDVTPKTIRLTVGDPLLWGFVKQLTGKVSDVGSGTFELTLSAQNLGRIYRFFEEHPPLPSIRSGKNYVEELKNKVNDYKAYRSAVAKVWEKVLSKEPIPVEPNGKFFPYIHQTWLAGTGLANPYSPWYADCGLGKTGSLARFVELQMANGSISRGKVLITAPLSIVQVSWLDDIKKFTNLRPCLLWSNKSNRTLTHGEEIKLLDFGPAPTNYLTKKTKRGTWHRHLSSGQVKREITTFDDKRMWQPLLCSWKTAVLDTGGEVPFGELKGKLSSKENTKELLLEEMLSKGGSEFDVFVTNHDSVRIYEDLFKKFGFEWVIVDESSKIKSPTSQLSKAHIAISEKCKRRNVMSGTPNPNGFTDLWMQFYFLDRGITLEPSYKDFLQEYFRPVSAGRRKIPGAPDQEIIRYEIRNEEAKQRLVDRVRATGIYLKQRDCIDLPERVDLKRIVYMTEEQEQAYKSMSRTLAAEFRDRKSGKIVEAEATNILSKIMKLRQITSGFLTNTLTEEVVKLEHNPKFEELDNVLEEIGDNKCIVAAQFREEIISLESRYKELGALAIHGGVKLSDRNDAVEKLQKDPSTKMLILQPAAAAHGITLTEANYMILTSLDYNFDNYYQVAKRIERIGQKQRMFVIHVLARCHDDTPTIDEDLLEVLQYKNAGREALFTTEMPNTEIAETLVKRLIERAER